MQGLLEDALQSVLRREVRLTVAGRTDAGVHALGQVASHSGAPASAASVNGLLPADARVVAIDRMPDSFDARCDARSRTYRYRVYTRQSHSPFERGRSLHYPYPRDEAALERCAELIRGTHDFTAFTPAQTDHVRFERDVLRAEWVRGTDHVIEFVIEADTFMRHMVRTLIGTMLAVARGRMPVSEFEALLAGRPRHEAGDTAPAHGLYLDAVRY